MAGVKNLRLHFSQLAMAGTLPSYLRTMKLRSAMARTVCHNSDACATLKNCGQKVSQLSRTGRYTQNPSSGHSEIAVGTVIADCPPRGPGRALISASGSYLG